MKDGYVSTRFASLWSLLPEELAWPPEQVRRGPANHRPESQKVLTINTWSLLLGCLGQLIPGKLLRPYQRRSYGYEKGNECSGESGYIKTYHEIAYKPCCTTQKHGQRSSYAIGLFPVKPCNNGPLSSICPQCPIRWTSSPSHLLSIWNC